MYPKWHIISSTFVALSSLLFDQTIPVLSISLLNQEIGVFILCLIVGIAIDVDHLVDYHVHGARAFKGENMIIVFHGIENIAILAFLSILFPATFLVFPTVSYTCHMVMDLYGNDKPFFSYFYVKRFGKKLLT